MIYSCLLGDKSDALRIDEKKYGGTKQQMNALPKFESLAISIRQNVDIKGIKIGNHEAKLLQ